ncbi:peptidylprolyl isomerase [Chromobacterium subtsugae]|uniref:peptidylprolyl isomerase n=1 Tax=Chromobacterium subtsugae TaxID=251747 RepID=A0ABS7FDK8_9NEIS|nr:MULTISPECIES: peptidylprolyl isomerase [Chromobacterium]KUM03043.1 peptidylprolyl isomerase [Chromobacterium subtsugae]KZE86002.1 peptidylprolyl isomerase [Chromobacterium sp. F49]MBW7567379.1 peptidylprolyl isomerase [Chromobacterium subtsugae]MBW8287545.1 peptidylprolyl isomerase [Chromobacterium subtsugae]OBU84800.1 peptidylprolyl isomerase [Chromobacterium subtsugae]
MRKLLLTTALVAAFAGSAIAVAGPSINGQQITDARIDAVAKMMEAQGQNVTPQARDQIKDQLVTAEVLRQEAVKKGLDKSPEFTAELANMQAMALANRLVKDFEKANPVSDADLKAEYDKLAASVPETKQYHARHILVKTEAEAKAVIEALKKGKAFDKLAKEKSIDPGSKNKGGDLDWQEAGTFVAPFSEAMSKLAKGEVTAKPVKTEYGWHVIKLDDVRTQRNVPSLEEIRPQLTQRVMGSRIEKYVADLKAKAQIQQ